MSEKKGIYNLFVVCGTELFLFLLCLKGIGAIQSNVLYPLLDGIRDAQQYEFWYWAGYCSLFLLPTGAMDSFPEQLHEVGISWFFMLFCMQI